MKHPFFFNNIVEYGMASFMHSWEGVTQGGPLEMIVYGIDILPLIKNLKEIPNFTQPWYADKIIVLGTFSRTETYFNLLTCQGLGRGYYPKPSKRVLIVHLENIKAGKVFQIHCSGFGTALRVTHALSLFTGGLVIARHNEIRDKLLYLSRRAFTPS